MAKVVTVGAREGEEGGAAGELVFRWSSKAMAMAAKLWRNPSLPPQGGGRRWGDLV